MKVLKLFPLALLVLLLFTSELPAGKISKNAGFLKSQFHAEQIVFSGTGTSDLGPFGFWIWSEDEDAPNPYHGNASGAIYIYALGLVKHVEGTVEEVSEGSYTISVASRDGAIVAALTNTAPVVHGPRNRVDVVFSTPAGSGVSMNAVVNVTGPE